MFNIHEIHFPMATIGLEYSYIGWNRFVKSVNYELIGVKAVSYGNLFITSAFMTHEEVTRPL